MNGLPVSIVGSVLVVAGVFGNGVDNGWRVVAGANRSVTIEGNGEASSDCHRRGKFSLSSSSDENGDAKQRVLLPLVYLGESAVGSYCVAANGGVDVAPGPTESGAEPTAATNGGVDIVLRPAESGAEMGSDSVANRTSKDVNVKNDINKFPEEEDDLGDSIEDGVNGKQGFRFPNRIRRFEYAHCKGCFKMKFDSEENAHAFYNAYAKVMGFSIRKDRKKVRRENVVVSRKWVCSRQGVRAKKYLERVDRLRAPRAETRVGCKAIFRVRYDVKMGEYIVTHFVSEHNHPLVAPHCVLFLWSHRSVTSADKAQTKAMRNVGISTGQIMDLMTIQSGGFDKDGDAEGILGYLSAKALDDPLFFYKYDVNHENCLDKLFWADSRSRLDYAAFGDVLVFDTTYRTNAYKKPFVMFCGVSNHYLSIIFGCALLPNETTETYMWVLETLMEAMDGKKPISVVIDGDKAMRQAIITVIPSAKHRLCTWHLQRNAVSNVHKPKFHEDFKRLKSLECDRDEFDKAWAVLVKQYNIESNSWVVEAYRNRHKWAESYLRGHFFAGMSSSQRCEGMHGYFNRFLKVRLKLYEFVWHYDRAIARMRVNEAAAEGFRAEMELEAKFYVKQQLEEEDHYVYKLEQYATENKWRVEFHPFDVSIKCPCMKLESFGIPCCHIIAVMKFQQLVSIPTSCVVQRWTRSARSSSPQPGLAKIPNLLTQTTRYGILSSSFNLLSYYASHTDKDFMEAREVDFQMMCELKNRWEMRNADKGEEKNSATKLFGIQDPKVVKTKGNPGGSSSASKIPTARKCGNCRSIGHTKRTCKKEKAKEREGCEEHFSAFTNPEFFPHQDEDGRRFRSRAAVTVERFVDMDKLVRTGIHNLILDSNLENLMEQKGQANVDMVREFFHGIIRPYDIINHKMVSVLRGVKVEFSADSIAKFLKVDRPNPYDERQYPFLSGFRLPDKLEIAKALYVNGITPTDEWCVRFLKPDVSVLHVMVWYNLDPRGVKNAFNLEKARMLYKIIKKDPIDVGKIIWKVVEVASKAAHATAALPYGLLITKILLENDVPVRDGLEGDSWKPQMSAIARGTLRKTQGQSRKHRAGTDPASLESIAARLDEALALIKKNAVRPQEGYEQVKGRCEGDAKSPPSL
ncbi:hypothetical protein RHSIM_Rhsim04G0115100 [Rhododendron simsii]|uniref:SWIM-type domain-containing protein n=1 Tax=Rhododendron simsii TaxID=118357 RepID=A0A834H3L5_RHOSS|nr:hypothetical protein RHSIM_Rhsim04G0115100 [Rhododendron simsii]